jgi:peptide chain release factor 2
MITIDELKAKLGGMKTAVDDLRDALSIEASEKRLAELEHQMTMPGFYDDQARSQKVISEMGEVKNKLERFGKLSTQYEEAETLLLMIEEENDPSLAAEGEEAVNGVEKSIDELQLMTMLNGEYDHNNAILTFHAGTGGTEAQDWAEMLYRMYTRWAEAHGYSVEVLDVLDGDEAGIKSASMMVKGPNAYGMLKSEHGVHRLVRISPFDASGRRHTSFAAVEVMPEITEDSEIELRDEDIKMDVYRSSGAGGQKVNKTSSAVRLTHIPTGIVVSSQVERSHFQNLENCKNMLRARLAEIKEREHLEKISDIKGVQLKIEWGSQIRSYVFMPYTLAKDHRTGYENGNIQAVMDGDIDGFINAYLSMNADKENK